MLLRSEPCRYVLPGTQFRLTDQRTSLYAKPDGWSDVVQQLSSGAVVTFNELVGSFARVTTDGAVGYIPGNAGADSISPSGRITGLADHSPVSREA